MSNKKEPRITFDDVHLMISVAKTTWASQSLPMKISKKTVLDNNPAHVAMIESVIMYLNGKGLLKELPKVDYDEK